MRAVAVAVAVFVSLLAAPPAGAQPATEAIAPVPPESPLLVHGLRGAEVLAWQEALNSWLSTIAAAPVLEDGIFGDETDAATRALQERAGLTVDGVVGPRTRAALAQLTASADSDGAVDEPVVQMPVEGGDLLSTGVAGREVAQWQAALNVWLQRSGHAQLVVDGVFGEATHEATLLLQESAGLAADGVVGPLTRAALDEMTAGSEAADG